MWLFNELNDTDINNAVGFVFVCLIIFIAVILIPGGSKYKPDPDENGQRKIAKSILRGETTVEDVAKNEGYDPEHIGKWVGDYTNLAIKYALDSDKLAEHIVLLEEDIAWFTSVCRKYIGDDWKEKTGFGDHNLDKYK